VGDRSGSDHLGIRDPYRDLSIEAGSVRATTDIYRLSHF
jgi:hypothetical protein